MVKEINGNVILARFDSVEDIEESLVCHGIKLVGNWKEVMLEKLSTADIVIEGYKSKAKIRFINRRKGVME